MIYEKEFLGNRMNFFGGMGSFDMRLLSFWYELSVFFFLGIILFKVENLIVCIF